MLLRVAYFDWSLPRRRYADSETLVVDIRGDFTRLLH